MATILNRSPAAGLEGSCNDGAQARPAATGLEGSFVASRASDWVRADGPIGGVERLQAWFGGRAFARHRHDTYGIGVTDVGIQAFDYRGKLERSRPGQVTVLHPDEVHDGRAGTAGGFGYRIVYVEPAHIAEAVRAISGRPTALPFVREPVSDNPTLAEAVADAFRAPLDPLARDGLIARLAEGLLEGDPAGRTADLPRLLDQRALARARDFLDSQRTTVRSAELEAVTGLSRYELARQFRQRYGTSPHRYALIRRLDFARAQLHRRTSLAELALAAGFADQAHFTRMFRSAYGVTPGRYVRLHASDHDAEDCAP